MTRVGASQVFFNVVAGFNARKLIQDVDTTMNVMRAVTLDSFEAMLKPMEDLALEIKIITNEIVEVSSAVRKAQVEFEKFYGGIDDTRALGREIEGIAEAYGVVGDEARIAGARAAQVGAIIGHENIPLLVEQAEILHQISDLTSEEAMKSIISLNQQTGMLYGDLNQQGYQRLGVLGREAVLTKGLSDSLNTLNTIANRSVAVEGQLVEVMTNFASQGALVGDSFEDMAAMSAVLLESGEQAGAAGRALRMIYARLGGDIGGARTELEGLGFTLTDENGNLRTMTEVLQELTDRGWSNFSQATKQHIAQTIAGNRHYVRFIKLMENQERVTELSANALNDVDSAAEQAKTAMEDYAYQLDVARAKGENLKAQMGDTLLPIIVQQQKTANSFAEARLEMLQMIDSVPMLGKMLGRFAATMQAFGGIIKLSLGMQSMAIGVGMFQSVQEDLHGILIANETLHSKQATYFDMNVTASKQEQDILAHIQFQHQVINRHLERKNHLMTIINNLEMRAAPLREQEQAQTKHMLESRIEQIQYEEKATNMANMRVAMADKRLNSLDRIRNIQAASVAVAEHDLSLSERWNRVYKEKTTAQEYYTRQLIIDSDTMQTLKKSEVKQIEDANDKLHSQSMIYQRLIAENERVRTAQKAGIGLGGMVQNEAVVKDIKKAIPAFEEFKQKQTDIIKNLGHMGIKQGQLNEKQAEDLKLASQRVRGARNVISSLEDMQTGQSKHLKLNQYGVMVVRDLNKETLAHNIQLDNTLLKYQSLNDIEQKYRVYQEASLQARRLTTSSYNDLKETLRELGPIEAELADLIKQVEIAMREGADATVVQTELIDHLTGKSRLANKQIETMSKNMKKDYTRAQDKATMATRRFGFAMTSVLGTMLPMISDGKEAAIGASILFSTQLVPAIGQVVKGYQAMIASQIQLAAAQNLSAPSGFAMVKNLLKQNLVMIAVAGAIAALSYGYSKLSEEQAKAAESMKDATAITKDSIGSLLTVTDETGLFAEHSEFLEQKLGVQGLTIKEVANDEQLLLSVTQKLTAATDDYTGSQLKSIESTLEMLRILRMIKSENSELSDAVKEASREVRDTYEGAFNEAANSWDEFTAGIAGGFGMSEREEASLDLKDQLGLSGDAIDETYLGSYYLDIEQVLDETIKKMEKGRRLTQKELDNLAIVLDAPKVFEAIENLNTIIIDEGTAEEIEYTIFGEKGAEDAAGNIDLIGNSVQNLTEDIYKFGGAREELFFGGKYGNVTGSLYKQVVTQGVGTLYNKMDIVMSNNFHGFFNEEAAARRIINVLESYAANGGVVAVGEGSG